MIVTSKELLVAAKCGGYAVPALNVDNMESVAAVLQAAAECRAPVIVQTIPRTLAYGGIRTYAAMVRAMYNPADSDIAVHLDHGGSFDICAECIEAGYSSVMIDGSMLDFHENVKLTKKVVSYARGRGVSVEAELGTIGGKEETEGVIRYTEVDEALRFAEESGADSLAIAVGTAHGVYKGTPHIAVDRIAEIRREVGIPLVLHGASGLSEQVIRDCIAAGISKINFATQLRQAFTAGVKEGIAAHPDAYDPKVYMPYAIAAVKSAATDIIRLCGAQNKG